MNSLHLHSTAHAAPEQPQDIFTDAFRYWERRRIPYNLILAALFCTYVMRIWPRFLAVFHWIDILPLFVLVVVANVCYSTAYFIDLPVQHSAFRSGWWRWRWLLWLVGTLFALVLELYWLGDEVFPVVD